MSQTIAPAPNPKPQTLIHGPKPSWSLQVLGTLNLSSFTCTPTKNARLVFVVCGFGVCGLWFGVCGFGLGFVAHTFQFAPLSSPCSVQSSSHLPPSDIPKTLAPGASIAQATPKAAPPLLPSPPCTLQPLTASVAAPAAPLTSTLHSLHSPLSILTSSSVIFLCTN